MPSKFIKAYFRKSILFILILSLISSSFSIFGQENLEEICQLEKIEEERKILSKEDYQKLLEKCQGYYEEKSGQIEQDISKTEKEKRTLQNQIAILKNQIKKLDYQISQSNLMIKDLKLQIGDTENSIKKNSEKIDDFKKKLINILRLIYEEDQRSLVEILLVEPKLSNFFDNLMALEKISSKNQELLKEIKALKSYLEEQKTSLDTEKEDLEKAVQIQTLQKQESEKTKQEKDYFLKLTETEYQKYLKEKKELEKRAAEIMARIAQLTLPGLDVPTSREELYGLANWAGNLTGVRPALILGLIEVESALGTNVGQCNCAGQPICRHPELGYKQVMPSNQWDFFEKIIKELGLNINTTPVSCWVGEGKIQMGGAMGPAQFMPNTWLKYKTTVESKTGVIPAHPWRARDTFLAAGLYLADWNANTQVRTNEIGAVTAYLCGTNIMTARCQRAGGVWFRNLVMQKTDRWQEWINQGISN